MAMIKCKECGKEISDAATTCPGCGCSQLSVTMHLSEKVNLSDCRVKTDWVTITVSVDNFDGPLNAKTKKLVAEFVKKIANGTSVPFDNKQGFTRGCCKIFCSSLFSVYILEFCSQQT